jgi:hypothetical protein
MAIIIAVVVDTNDYPISDDFFVDNDDFSAVEAAAEAAGERCCIRWYRISDGQIAYWGPYGATLKPHWYPKASAPKPCLKP